MYIHMCIYIYIHTHTCTTSPSRRSLGFWKFIHKPAFQPQRNATPWSSTGAGSRAVSDNV